MSAVPTTPSTAGEPRSGRSFRSTLAALELDTRLLGMIVALAVIWILFNILSGGNFITPRNLWNLSVQSASIAIMATGMVLIIVSRNIDLSVGSMLGLIGYVMAMIQVVWLPQVFGVSYNEPWIWIVALAAGILLGAAIGCGLGHGRRLPRRPVLHRHPGRAPDLARPDLPLPAGPDALAAQRDLPAARRRPQGIARGDRQLDPRRHHLRGDRLHAVGRPASQEAVWLPGPSAVGRGRGRRRSAAARCSSSSTSPTATRGRRPSPTSAAKETGNAIPPGGIPTGIAIPVVIMLLVGLVMTYLATRRRFGRYVYAIGGNPDAAELGGINVRATIMKTFVLMGILAAISAAVQTARLNSAVTNLGVQNELDVIAAAVIGGTSFAGGIGTIPGAILGAVVMQSLRSGMLLLNVDSPTQDVVVGMVLVAAVGFDSYLRRRAG